VASGPFCSSRRVAYWEVDQQRVVFHGHWLTYFDDAMSRFLDSLGFPPRETFSGYFDAMVVKAEIEWQGAVGFDEWVDITVVPTRLGSSSFDLSYQATTGGRAVCRGTVTYVSVKPGAAEACPIPDDVRAALEGAM
jgi:acyl-CoA thioester hydrolase